MLTLRGQNTTEGGITVASYHHPAKIGPFEGVPNSEPAQTAHMPQTGPQDTEFLGY